MKKQYIYAGISIFLWSTTATVTKLLLSTINSMQILLVSSFFASIFLLIVNPSLSLIWTGLILKDKISIYSVIGLIVIVLGIIIQLKDEKKKYEGGFYERIY